MERQKLNNILKHERFLKLVKLWKTMIKKQCSLTSIKIGNQTANDWLADTVKCRTVSAFQKRLIKQLWKVSKFFYRMNRKYNHLYLHYNRRTDNKLSTSEICVKYSLPNNATIRSILGRLRRGEIKPVKVPKDVVIYNMLAKAGFSPSLFKL